MWLDRTTGRQEATGKQRENKQEAASRFPSSSPAVSLSTHYWQSQQGATGKAEMQSRISKIGVGIKRKILVTGTDVEDYQRSHPLNKMLRNDCQPHATSL